MKMLLNWIAILFALYFGIGLVFATVMCVAAREFNLAAFLLMTLIWPLVLAFHLAAPSG